MWKNFLSRFAGEWSRFLKGAAIDGFITATFAFKGLLQEHRVSIGINTPITSVKRFSHPGILTFWVTCFTFHRLITGGLRVMLQNCPFRIATLMLLPWVMGYEMWWISGRPCRRCFEY